MIELTAAQVAEAVSGTLQGLDNAQAEKVTVTSATTDSRKVVAKTLFLAKPGEVTDGHKFLPQAFEAGASLALVEHAVTCENGEIYPSVLVDDVVLAMGRLASYIVQTLRASGDITVVGITGSAGKTTTKDLLAAIFETSGATVAPIGSYNGEVGVPLTVFRADYDTRYLVIEMGADGLGHIEYLANMVQPDFGAILKVGTAHAGEFGGIDNIEKTKGELAEGVLQGLALNDDDERVRRMLSRSSVPTIFFGLGQQNTGDLDNERVYATDLVTGASGCPEFTLHFPLGEKYPVKSKLIGEHHVHNLLAAATVAYQAGISPDVIAQQLNISGAVSRWRMERTDRTDGVTIINDAYNANPESMAAALRALAQLGRGSEPRRTWAVLGAMLELGDASVDEHDRLGRLVVRMNISKLIAIGQEAKPIYNAAHLEGSWGNEATWVETREEALEILRAELAPGDIVLFKSSNGAGLRLLGDEVANDTHRASDDETRPASWLSAGDFVDTVNSKFGA